MSGHSFALKSTEKAPEKAAEDKPAGPPGLSGGTMLERVANHIYFYSDIERDKVLMLNKAMQEAAREILADKQARGLGESVPIYLHVQSYGGVLFAGLSAMDEILRCPVPVVTIVDGCVASAATFLTVVGGRRQMSRNAYMLIHQINGGHWGTYWQLKDGQRNYDAFMRKIEGIYRRYTRVPAKKLKEILSHDLWWDAKLCLKYGLVDEII